jgi:hypothetical protein
MNDLIGFFVARFKGEQRLTRYHLVESEIADRKITRCGRQLHHQEGTSLTVIVGPPPSDTGCKRCQ